MSIPPRLPVHGAVLLFLVTLIAGCGGGDSSSGGETPPVPLSIGVYDATVVEGGGNLGFLVTLSKASDEDVMVEYRTTDDSAVAGTDYEADNGQVVFAAGETQKTVNIGVLNNSAAQEPSTKSMHLELNAVSDISISRSTAEGFIIDKDQMVADSAFDPTWSDTGVFSNADSCANCHKASDAGASSVLMRGPNDEDVSANHQWDHSVMAHAFDDPYYQAAVEDEASHFPHLAGFIEDTCLNCHSPMARTHAHQANTDLDADGFYRFETALTHDHAREGVSCTLCHQIQDDGNLGAPASFSGNYSISSTDMDIYGPYGSPVGTNMESQTGYAPMYGSHISSSAICATCHTLHTPTLSVETGQPTGDMFLEQGPYLEWQNSVFVTGSVNEKQCQDCHMPEPSPGYATRLSATPGTTAARTPYASHNMVGGNTYLLEILKKYRSVLGIAGTTTEAGFDAQISLTRNQLENDTASIEIDGSTVSPDRLDLDVLVTNHTGHKLPTSYPSRRAWIHMKVSKGTDVIFESGKPDPATGYLSTDAGRLSPECMASEKLPGFSNDGCFEPHRDVITDQSQIAIYEAVLGDTNGHITHTLLLADSYLKDNRLVPEGFTNTKASTIDAQTLPVGVNGDQDFNYASAVEGSGTDIVHYQIPLSGQIGPFDVEVRLLYQALQPGFVDGLHAHGERVSRFKVMYQETPPTVEVLASEVTQVN
jgi:hypothetical protein